MLKEKYVRCSENRDDVGLKSNHHSQGGGADSPPQVQDAGHVQQAGGVLAAAEDGEGGEKSCYKTRI